ncbi:peptidoglycan DD-metalloendopeptidase family protein [Bacillus shivajii]|uniref:M23 family metallopeptidase n=1 Tax=Bacillus shivajii TaxID=1983719 RepID=UPI001CF9A9B9|nr:M23 family metallopeptidase [Bacillus shivajii]UCZ51882.1 peptidoglycan DD-metalloendopeptidase family protein [Bacillus shivajii]
MKKYIFSLFTVFLLTACQEQPPEDGEEDNNLEEEQATEDVETDNDILDEEDKEEIVQMKELNVYEMNDKNVIKVEELANKLNGEFTFDEMDRTLKMTISDREFYLVYEIPVLEVDGEYLATDEVLLVIDDDSIPYVTKEFINHGLETEYESVEGNELAFVWEDKVVQAWAPPAQDEFDLHSLTVEEMIDYLSFLNKPIEGAQVSTVESHLPGAPRNYRHGTHEGIDWYAWGSGIEITTDTPILAMAEGKVVRVDHGFEEYPSPEVRNEDLDLAAEIGLTPEYILDRLRGKQVWVQYENGVMNRFAHLDRIPDELELGQIVNENTVIGYVGNTGTSHAFTGENGGLHLHQDLLIYGELFWEPYEPQEVTQILKGIWGNQ